jgi:hypothetical protein
MANISNIAEQILSWEAGDMDEAQEDAFFQELVDTGLAWQLQGMYGRRAEQLINEGRITR